MIIIIILENCNQFNLALVRCLNIKTILFKVIKFSRCTLFSSI